MTANSPPPGWYTDGQGGQRWWDGEQWYEAVGDATGGQPQAEDASPTPESDSLPETTGPSHDPDSEVPESPELDQENASPSPAPQPAMSPSKSGRSKVWIPLIALIVAALGIGTFAIATAGPSSEERRIATEKREAAEAEEAEQAAQAELAQQKATCESTVAEFKDAVAAVDAKLNVGLVQSDLNNALGDASVAYDKLELEPILDDSYCISDVLKPLEDAFNIYVKSNTKWNKCNQDFGCEVKGKVLENLQGRWLRASLKVVQAEGALENYGAGSGT